MVLSNIKPRNNERGFTIVELLIVIVVIAILATITIVAYSGITSRANNTKAQAQAASVQKVAEAFNADNGRYPASLAEFTAGSLSTKLPSGVTVISGLAGTSGTVFTGTDPLIAITAANKANTITYSCFITCTNSTGGRINYWDFQTAAKAATTIYVGSGADTGGAFVILP
jgi:prepilin-type N-terminal cleavage/methylation domain-containing protein